jgi:hypothetical protein
MATTTNNVLNTQVVPNVPIYGNVFQPMNAAWIQYFFTLNQRVGGANGSVVNAVVADDISVPPIFTITNTETTATDGSNTVTIDLLLANQPSNYVLVGPATGSPAQPTFRPLSGTDFGTITYANGGTGLTAEPTSGQIPIGTGAGYALHTIAGTANEIIVTNGSGTITLSLAPNLSIPAPVAGTSLTVFGGTGVAAVSIGAGSGGQSINATGLAQFNSSIAVYGGTGIAQSTGWGAPTAGSLVTNFPGTGATTAQCGGVISELIGILQAIGFLAA